MILWRGVGWWNRFAQLFLWAVLLMNAFLAITLHSGLNMICTVSSGVFVMVTVWSARIDRSRAWRRSR